ncbi:MAG: choice-of-anchor D domain-containing protein, partial [Candidatus Acidiferrum sp.]
LNAWRQQVVCLFGLGTNGGPINTVPGTGDVNQIPNPAGAGCPGSGWTFFNPFDESGAAGSATNPQVDRLPLEATVGWDANLNGNLAELLQEPSLMGALEGAGVTVLSKGVVLPSDPFDATLLAGFPAGTTLLQNLPGVSSDYCYVTTVSSTGVVTENTTELSPNPYPSNFMCNPSSIDGLGITDSSQGGGGIFIHAWGHNLQVGNNRIYNNAGTLSGGINLGQGEFPGAYIQGAGAVNAPPGSCEDSPVFNAVLPYCQNVNVNIHNNYIASNSSTGDELFSATPAGAGGVSICTGSDYYKFNYNWVCGNLSSGDGGGVGHIGFTFNGDIEHNTIIFNQSTNPTIPTNGGGLIVMGAPDADLTCNGTIGAAFDQDCAPFGAPGGNPGNTPVAQVGPSDGAGPGLVINANLIMGNEAQSGTGAGIAFNSVNGSDMVAFPTDPGQWNLVTVTNNIIVDNVGGWDGAGISLHDSPNVNIINNTIAYNNSTASAGILFNTLGAPLASQFGNSCTSTATTTCPQPGGLVAIQHSAVLAANLPATLTVTCPPGHFQGTAATNGSCKTVSYPKLENNIFWHNATLYIGVGALSPAFQQHIVSIFNSFTHTAVTSQPVADAITTTGGSATITGGTGACVANTQYWDIGVRGDTGPTNHGSGVTLHPTDSVMTNITGYTGASNSAGNPNFTQQYCDGSRVSPETPGLLAAGWVVPPGISDATVPNPIFNLTPTATVDEGNNWVNLRWGPLAMTNPTVLGADGNYGGGPALGNYAIVAGSSAISRVGPGTNFADAPNFDFFDKPRKPGTAIDAGAVQLSGTATNTDFTVSPASLDFGFSPDRSPATADQDVQVINSGSVSLSFNSGNSFTITGANAAQFAIQSNTCASSTIAPGEACVVNVIFIPSGTQGVKNATLNVNPIGNGAAETVSLTGRDTIATIAVAGPAPAMNTGSTVAVTGTVTYTNTIALTNVNAGPFTPTAITITRVSGAPQTAWALGGTCVVGTPVAPQTSCTVTVTYTPPGGSTATSTATLSLSEFGTVAAAPITQTITAN